jgi:hypothetical protein
MCIDQRHRRETGSIVARPVPGRPELLHLHVQDDTLRAVGLAVGDVLEADCERRPLDGDLVWVELVRRGTLVQMLRRYRVQEGVVTLTDPAGREPSIIRQPGELQVRAVVTTPV